MNEEQELLELYKNKDIDKLFDKVGEYYHKWLNNTKKLDFYKQEIERLNKSLEEQRHFYLEKLQQKENIIKEVRKHLQETINRWEDYEQFYEVVEEDKYILEILDREEK